MSDTEHLWAVAGGTDGVRREALSLVEPAEPGRRLGELGQRAGEHVRVVRSRPCHGLGQTTKDARAV